MVLLIGPFAALIGVVAVFFVIRHKSVQTKSMYSSRRSQIEHKVRAARQRTLGPEKRVELKETAAAKAAPTVENAPATPIQSWGAGPSAPPPPTVSWDAPPSAAPPAYAPPAAPAPQEPVWTPPPEPVRPSEPARPREPAAPAAPAATSGGASWSVVSEAKEESGSQPGTKDKGKKKKKVAQSPWQLAGGAAPGGYDLDDEPKRPSVILAVAQYMVLVVGLVMVLIGVLVMVANSRPT